MLVEDFVIIRKTCFIITECARAAEHDFMSLSLFKDLHWDASGVGQPVQRLGHLQQEANGYLYGS